MVFTMTQAMKRAPFRLLGEAGSSPIVIAVPHAGRYYPPDVLARARVDRAVLDRLADPYVDIFADALAMQGAFVLVADMARAAMDLNRAAQEWDARDVAGAQPRMPPSRRVLSGLGLIPRQLHGVGDLWRRRMDAEALRALIDGYHRPWHGAIADALIAARARFGMAILIDLHSMPTQALARPQWVIGDRHGRSASAELADRLIAVGEGAGLIAARNHPYAGGYATEAHGRPLQGVEAVQIEIDRALYLTADGTPDGAGCAHIAGVLARCVETAAQYVSACGQGWAQAAE